MCKALVISPKTGLRKGECRWVTRVLVSHPVDNAIHTPGQTRYDTRPRGEVRAGNIWVAMMTGCLPPEVLPLLVTETMPHRVWFMTGPPCVCMFPDIMSVLLSPISLSRVLASPLFGGCRGAKEGSILRRATVNHIRVPAARSCFSGRRWRRGTRTSRCSQATTSLFLLTRGRAWKRTMTSCMGFGTTILTLQTQGTR